MSSQRNTGRIGYRRRVDLLAILLTLVVGVAVSAILDSFILGFAAVAAVALLILVGLELRARRRPTPVSGRGRETPAHTHS